MTKRWIANVSEVDNHLPHTMFTNSRLSFIFAAILGVIEAWSAQTAAFATPSTVPEVLAHRGAVIMGQGTAQPTLALKEPTGGWTSAHMIQVAGKCSDETVNPVIASINGVRYYIRSEAGEFDRKFPAARGQNTVTVECTNKGGTARETRTITGVMSAVRLKIVLTSDTDGVYTDLHMYEPDGRHVYWADTASPTGGLFFLNQQGDSSDQPGYGPYLYVHPSPPIGVYRIDTNYWPGGAVQHTLATLDIVTDEGLPTENRRRVNKPLARPGETQTLAYVVVRPNGLPIKVYVPGQDNAAEIPEEIKIYQREVEPKFAKNDEYAFIPKSEEGALRKSVVIVALAQAQQTNSKWTKEQRDCAGLVRFAYKEALESRTEVQIRALPKEAKQLPALRFPVGIFIPTFPKVWSTGYSKDGKLKHGYYADAETLLGFNFRLKSRSLDSAAPGDVLAFRKDVAGDEPYHLMVFAGPDARRGVVVYHTGSEPKPLPRRAGYIVDNGAPAVRVVTVASLRESPDPVWMPVEENPHFLGVFEWNRFKPDRDRMSSVL